MLRLYSTRTATNSQALLRQFFGIYNRENNPTEMTFLGEIKRNLGEEIKGRLLAEH